MAFLAVWLEGARTFNDPSPRDAQIFALRFGWTKRVIQRFKLGVL